MNKDNKKKNTNKNKSNVTDLGLNNQMFYPSKL